MTETSGSRTTLVCTLGTGKYQDTIYSLDGQDCKCKFSPISVGRLVAGDAGLKVVALTTEESEQAHGAEFESEVRAQGWQYQPVRIPKGQNEAELWEIFEGLEAVLSRGQDVILDPTHSLRSTGIVLIAALNYYRVALGLRSIRVFYGAYDVGQLDPESGIRRAPLFDLTPAIALAEWTYGLQVLREYQIATPLATQLEQVQISARRAGRQQPPSNLQSVAKLLRQLDPMLRYALPLEIGIQAGKLVDKAQDADAEIEALPPMRTPWAELKRLLQGLQLKEPRKQDVHLDEAELDRQARIIDRYLGGGNVWAAYALLREWMVSVVLLHNGQAASWLDYNARDAAEAQLNGAAKAAEKAGRARRMGEPVPEFTDDEKLPKELVDLWSTFRKLRNDYAHAGMNTQDMSMEPEKMRANLNKYQSAFSSLRRVLRADNFYRSASGDSHD